MPRSLTPTACPVSGTPSTPSRVPPLPADASSPRHVRIRLRPLPRLWRARRRPCPGGRAGPSRRREPGAVPAAATPAADARRAGGADCPHAARRAVRLRRRLTRRLRLLRPRDVGLRQARHLAPAQRRSPVRHRAARVLGSPAAGRPRLLPRPRARRHLHRPRAHDPCAANGRAGRDRGARRAERLARGRTPALHPLGVGQAAEAAGGPALPAGRPGADSDVSTRRRGPAGEPGGSSAS